MAKFVNFVPIMALPNIFETKTNAAILLGWILEMRVTENQTFIQNLYFSVDYVVTLILSHTFLNSFLVGRMNYDK